MDYSTMVDAVQDTVDDTSTAGETRIKRYLNWAQNDIASRKDWSFLRTSATFDTTSGTEEYTLDAGCHKIINMRDTTNENLLQEIDFRAFAQSVPAPSTTDDTGQPRYWYPTHLDSSGDQMIKFYPVPDGTYTVNYDFYKRITDMSGDTDIPDIPAKYHQLLVDFACYKFLQQDQDPMAQQFYIEYQNKVDQMMSEIQAESDGLSSMKPASHGKQVVRDLRF